MNIRSNPADKSRRDKACADLPVMPTDRRAFLTSVAVGGASLAVAGRLQAAPEIPGKDPKAPVALVGGTVHPVSGPAIPRAVVLFAQGKIVAVGDKVQLPAGTLKIDVAGKHVYPGLFDALTNMGLIEINSVRATVDDAETGSINPNVRAIVAVNPDSEQIPVTRANGVLLALTAPAGGILTGRSSVIQLDGWTWEDMTVREDVALHVHWPDMHPGTSTGAGGPARETSDPRERALDELRRAFETAAAYRQSRQAPDSRQALDARWESLVPVLEGRRPVVIHADELLQIQAAVAFVDRWKLKAILYGGYDAPRVAGLLRERKIPVIVAGTYRVPLRKTDDYDAAYTVPARLREAGVTFCIGSTGRFGASQVRNLPYHAANASAYGLAPEEALKAITLYPAQILGVADRVGSLEVGKDATLFVCDGDPLETPTKVEQAFVQGREVELNDRHKRLWRKYEEKYRRTKEMP